MAKTIYREEYRLVVSRLRESRETLGISQTELANRLGQKQQWVSQMESGSRRLDIIEFVEICLALDVHPTTAIAPILKVLAKTDAPTQSRHRAKAKASD